MTKYIILDRDGVINQDSLAYIKSPEEFILLPGSTAAIGRLTSAGYRIAIATNQSGIARGYYDEQQLDAIHAKMLAAITADGGQIDIIKYCPHMPNSCACRKPAPGMLLAIAAFWNCSLQQIPVVGDRISDIEVALAVGATPLLVRSNMTDFNALANYPSIPSYVSLAECVNDLLDVAV